MAKKTKYSKQLINDICAEHAQGRSIRSCLSPGNKKENRPCWETFKTWLNKNPEVREQYTQAKSDGIEYLLSDSEEVIKEALANSKLKEKTDLGQTHLIKAYLDLNKWKSEKLSPKVYGKQSDSLTLLGKDASIQVKWQK